MEDSPTAEIGAWESMASSSSQGSEAPKKTTKGRPKGSVGTRKGGSSSQQAPTKKRKVERYASNRMPPPKPKARPYGTFGPEAAPEACDPLLGWLRELSAATQARVSRAAAIRASSDLASSARKRLADVMTDPQGQPRREDALFPAIGCFAHEMALVESFPSFGAIGSRPK